MEVGKQRNWDSSPYRTDVILLKNINQSLNAGCII